MALRSHFKHYRNLSLTTRGVIAGVKGKGLKPQPSREEEKAWAATLSELRRLAKEQKPSQEKYSVYCKTESFDRGNLSLKVFSFTPASDTPPDPTKTDIISMAVVYVPGNLETVAGQYGNHFLQMLCHDLQDQLETILNKTPGEKNVSVQLTLFMMDYYGMSSNKLEGANYTETPLDTDAENIVGLMKYLANHHHHSVKNTLIIGHSLGGHVAIMVKNKLDQDENYHNLKILLDRTYGETLPVPLVGDHINGDLIAGGYMLPPGIASQLIESSPGILAMKAQEDTIMRRGSLVDTLKQKANQETIKGRLWNTFYSGSRRSSLDRTHQAFFQELSLGVPWLTPIELIAALMSETPISPEQNNPRQYFQKKLSSWEKALDAQYESLMNDWIQKQKSSDKSFDECEFRISNKSIHPKRVKTRHRLYNAYSNKNVIAVEAALGKDYQFDCDLVADQIKKNQTDPTFAARQDKRYADLLATLSNHLAELAEHEKLAKLLTQENWIDLFKGKIMGFDTQAAKALIVEATHCATHYTALQQNIEDFNQHIKKLTPKQENTDEPETLSTPVPTPAIAPPPLPAFTPYTMPLPPLPQTRASLPPPLPPPPLPPLPTSLLFKQPVTKIHAPAGHAAAYILQNLNDEKDDKKNFVTLHLPKKK